MKRKTPDCSYREDLEQDSLVNCDSPEIRGRDLDHTAKYGFREDQPWFLGFLLTSSKCFCSRIR